MSKIFFFTLFLSLPSWAFHPDLQVINDRAPHEFNIMFNSLKTESLLPSEQLRLVALSKDLNDHLGFLSKEHMFMLMKTEVIKGVLEFRFEKVRSFDVNDLLVKRLSESFKNKEASLNHFSRWLGQSIIAELKHRQNLGIIRSQGFSVQNFEGAKKQEALRFQRYLQYLLPWIDQMDSLTAPEFNALTKQVAWSIMERLNERSLLFGRFAGQSTSQTKTVIINIPQKLLDLHPEDIKKMQADEVPLTLKDQASQARDEALDKMEKVTPLDMSTLSDEVNKELQRKED